jgi:Raf kinase inhibitor-like YbhB/YbcL family protein
METIAVKTEVSISSPSFKHLDLIPDEFTCKGSGTNPALVIAGIPEGTKSLALIMEDPDAPGKIFDHWIVWNIPILSKIDANSVPGIEGVNGKGKLGYTGPCPPSGTHRYFFKVYCLDTMLNVKKGSDKSALQKAMEHHIVAYGELIGLYHQ